MPQSEIVRVGRIEGVTPLNLCKMHAALQVILLLNLCKEISRPFHFFLNENLNC